MPQAVIFDLDGTLYNKSHLAYRLIVSQLFCGKLSYLKNERRIKKELRGHFFESKDNFYLNFFSRFEDIDTAKYWYFNNYLPTMVNILKKHYVLFPWVENTILSLKEKGIKIVIYSDYELVEDKLSALNFNLDWADAIFSAPELGGLKPCEESMRILCKEIKQDIHNCLMIGDRLDTDGESASIVGMPFQLVENENFQLSID